MYAGCVAGALSYEDYMVSINKMGFINLITHKEKEIFLPDQVLSSFMTKEEIMDYRNSGAGIYSITMSGEKPAKGCVCCGT